MKSNWGPEMARSVASYVPRRDRASVTVLVLPTLYSTVKSNPRSLPTSDAGGSFPAASPREN